MIVIRTEIKEIPEYCEECCYFGSRPHPRKAAIEALHMKRHSGNEFV